MSNQLDSILAIHEAIIQLENASNSIYDDMLAQYSEHQAFHKSVMSELDNSLSHLKDIQAMIHSMSFRS